MYLFPCIFHSILYSTCKQELIKWKVSPLNLVKHQAEEEQKGMDLSLCREKKVYI